MRLELVHPPRLVSVTDAAGRRPGLLLATRADRHYVQVSHGAGLNCLRWVPTAAVGPPADLPPEGAASRVINGGLPPLFGAQEVRQAAVDHHGA